jgi:transcriptional regulator with XRE-family HTH domain
MNHAGLSQRKGAEKFGVSGRSLLYYMDGDRAPDIKVFAKIASDLEVSAAWLLNGEGTPGQS